MAALTRQQQHSLGCSRIGLLPAALLVSAFGSAAFALAAAARGVRTVSSGALRCAGSLRRCPAVSRRAEESFDPFGWKGAIKDTFDGIMGPEGDDQPSKFEEEMMREIFEKFDKDGNGILNLAEFNMLQLATEGAGAVYNQDQLEQLLDAINSNIEDPSKGMPFADYRRIYVERRLRQAYNTDVSSDYAKIFGLDAAKLKEDKGVEATPAAHGGLAVGEAVTITGLAGAVELNGLKGEIVDANDAEKDLVSEGRLIIKLSDGERVALKPANVVRVAAEATS